METFEQLGLFYLGREIGQDEGKDAPLLLYPSSNLSTHALCVGMTGSGKTGLCIGLLEEAAIDGIPALIIDPKGDMTNLCLGFPAMRAEDFLPWVDEQEAKANNMTREEYAGQVADTWKKGISSWGQSGERIELLRKKSDITVYTPASNAGEPLSLMESLAAPAPEVMQDFNSLSNLVQGTAAGLLGLLGIEADPLQSKETILLTNILQQAWHRGEDVHLASLIALIQEPPFDTVGVMDLDAFYPRAERDKLAMRFNSLIASPVFARWMKGHPLDIDTLLYNADGKPKLSILSIAHLTEEERMFFVSLFLTRLLAWTRSQTGSQSLRAILYMDEIYGYFPPVKNPPSKRPLLTLLKQSRAYGLGIVLTTQNPLDLDYKGLANIGTWWIGRLQTENDRARLLDGMQDAARASGENFSRSEMDRLIAGLNKREFLMNSVHARRLTRFESRFCLSYLKGPMSLEDIRQLSLLGLYDRLPQADAGEEITDPIPHDRAVAEGMGTSLQTGYALEAMAKPTAGGSFAEQKQVLASLPKEIPSYFLPTDGPVSYYAPLLAAFTEVYYLDKKTNESKTVRELRIVEPEDSPLPIRWDKSSVLDMKLEELEGQGREGVPLRPLSKEFSDSKNYKNWQAGLVDYLYRHGSLIRYENKTHGIRSQEGESLRDFRIRLDKETREYRDLEVEKLFEKYKRRLESQAEKVRKAKEQAEKRIDMREDAKRQTAISAGSSLLTALFGKTKLSAGALGKATTAGRSASRVNRLDQDVERAVNNLELAAEEYEKLIEETDSELAKRREEVEKSSLSFEEVKIKALKRDCKVRLLMILWQGRP